MNSDPLFQGNSRFSIIRKLGAGGFGVVYEAYDRERNGVVALKTLNRAGGHALYSFKQEFRALADITHPNLITLYELMSEQDQWFFTMELIDGVSFLEYLRGEPHDELTDTLRFDPITMPNERKTTDNLSEHDLNKRAPSAVTVPPSLPPAKVSGYERLRAALRQLAAGLYTLHKAGKLHRDIKPSNVLVTHEGRVVILDFGLVTELAQQSDKSDSVFGTPDYMAPECCTGLPITEASDWYSVGVMLYEALTTSLPFDALSGNVLLEKQRYEPRPPIELAADVPVDLNELCRELLHRDPALRPNGEEILARLGVIESSATSAAIGEIPLIGREPHLEALNAAYEKMVAGATVAVTVSGPSGMGKSLLVRRFLDNLKRRATGTMVLTGRCYEQESVPYKAFDSLIDALSGLLQQMPVKEKEEILPADFFALARLFPVLQKAAVSADGKIVEIPDSQELRRRAFGALRELFMLLSEKKGHALVLFIDDLHWGDADSAALLGELLMPPYPPVLLLIATMRSDISEASPMLSALRSAQVNNSNLLIDKITVGELAHTQACQLVSQLIPGSHPELLTSVERIAQESQGNPFFIHELVCYALTADNGERMRESSLERVIQARVALLPEAARRLLEMIAVAGHPLARRVIRSAARLESEEQTALAFLRAGHLVRTLNTGIQEALEIYHDRIRDSLIAAIPEDARKVYHQQLAETLVAESATDPELLAKHFQGAGDIEQAARFAIAAAEQAAHALAFDHAARLYRVALQLGQEQQRADSDNVKTLKIKLGEALMYAGRGYDAAEAYLAAGEMATGLEAIDLQRRAAEQLMCSGHFDRGMEVLRAVLRQVGLKVPSSSARALLSLLFQRALLAVRGFSFRERRESEIPPAELLRLEACLTAVRSLGLVDPLSGMEFQTRYLRLCLSAGEPFRIARALATEAVYSSTAGSGAYRRTEKRLERAMALAKRVNNHFALGVTYIETGMAYCFEGRWQKALSLLEQGEKILSENCKGISFELNAARTFKLRALCHLGQWGMIVRQLPVLLKDAHERGDLYAEINLRTHHAYYAYLASDQPQAACADIDDALKVWTQERFHIQHYFASMAKIDIAIYQGDGTAWQLATELWRKARALIMRVQQLRIEASFLKARAALSMAAASPQPGPWLTQAERCARQIEKERIDWGMPLVKIIRAAAAALRGNKKTAIAQLAAAEAISELADMSLHAFVARRRRGQLTGNDQLVAEADSWMAEQLIKKPARITNLFLPCHKD